MNWTVESGWPSDLGRMSSPTEAKANGIYEQERDTRVGSLRGCDGRRVDVMPARSAAHPGGDVFGAETQAIYIVFNLVAGVLENNIVGVSGLRSTP